MYAAPSSDSVTAVTSWLQTQNISASTTGPFGEYLSFSIPVSKANSLLSAEYINFTHSSSFGHLTSALYTYSYSLPTDVSRHISHIHPGTSFAPPLSRNGQTMFYSSHRMEASTKLATRADSASDSCVTLMTPSCVLSLYGIPSTPATQSTNILGVGSLQSNWAEVCSFHFVPSTCSYKNHLRKAI